MTQNPSAVDQIKAFEPSGNGTDILIIGQSHTEAVNSFLAQNPQPGIKVINLNRPVDNSISKGEFAPRLVEGLRPKIVVSMLEGNFHNILGLVEHPARFDFADASTQYDTTDATRVNIPYGMMREYFIDSLQRRLFDKILNIKSYFKDVPLFHACSPPPHPDSDFVKNNPGGYFSDKVHAGVSPPVLRRKLYELNARVTREFCEAHSIGFIAPPSDAVDNEGFLAEPYWLKDPTHANKAYGGKVLEQIRALKEAVHASV